MKNINTIYFIERVCDYEYGCTEVIAAFNTLEKAENYLEMLRHNYRFPYFNNNQYLNDMAQEIYINSQVTVSKFIYFRLSASILIVAFGLALVGLVLMLYTA